MGSAMKCLYLLLMTGLTSAITNILFAGLGYRTFGLAIRRVGGGRERRNRRRRGAGLGRLLSRQKACRETYDHTSLQPHFSLRGRAVPITRTRALGPDHASSQLAISKSTNL